MKKEYILIDKSNLDVFTDVPLFIKADQKHYTLFKAKGHSVSNDQVATVALYIDVNDKISKIEQEQELFNYRLKNYVNKGNYTKIKEQLVSIVDDTLKIPVEKNLKGLSKTVDLIVEDYSGRSQIVEKLVDFSSKDYSTTIHSINVMAFTLAYCYHEKLSEKILRILGLGALLHDVGKTEINDNVLKKTTALTPLEYEEIKTHALKGYNILKKCNFGERILNCALEHHEKLDGSGYPYGKKIISFEGQLISVIDCYEALISHYRRYKGPLTTYEASQIIKKDVDEGKIDKALFENFILSRLKSEA